MDDAVKRKLPIYGSGAVHSPSVMNDTKWFTIVGEAVIFCASLVQKIKTLKQQLQTAQEKLVRLKTVVKDLEERHGYDTVH